MVKKLVFYRIGEYPLTGSDVGILRVYLEDGRVVDMPAMFFEKNELPERWEEEKVAYVTVEDLARLGDKYIVEVTVQRREKPLPWENEVHEVVSAKVRS